MGHPPAAAHRNRNADAVVEQETGLLLFVEPYGKSEPFTEFLDYIQEDSRSFASVNEKRSVKYAQTRMLIAGIARHVVINIAAENDNLREEYNYLFADVPKDIPFARIALQKEADAINMWIGNEKSETAMHKDNYENIYVQVRGQKHFVLLPPVEMPCVNEQSLPQARYKSSDEADRTGESRLEIENISRDGLVPVPTWDPDEPDARTTAYSHLSRPMRMTLHEGDMLYLPAMYVPIGAVYPHVGYMLIFMHHQVVPQSQADFWRRAIRMRGELLV